jgi:hypothetical protein
VARAQHRVTWVAPITAVAFGCALLASACGANQPSILATGGWPVVLRDGASRTIVHVRVGNKVELILASDYWNVAGSSAPTLLAQDDPTRPMPRPSTCPSIAGLGCTPEETLFTAKAPGTAVITATRTSCGEALKCASDQEDFAVTVIIG